MKASYAKRFVKLAVVIGALFVEPAIAQSLVVCNGTAGSVEVDQTGGSTGPMSMTIRNSALTQNFIASGFISEADLDARGDLVIPMDEINWGHKDSRYFALDADGMGGYIFTVRYGDGRMLGRVLANFHFIKANCQERR